MGSVMASAGTEVLVCVAMPSDRPRLPPEPLPSQRVTSTRRAVLRGRGLRSLDISSRSRVLGSRGGSAGGAVSDARTRNAMQASSPHRRLPMHQGQTLGVAYVDMVSRSIPTPS